jgi:hypothetical protein
MAGRRAPPMLQHRRRLAQLNATDGSGTFRRCANSPATAGSAMANATRPSWAFLSWITKLPGCPSSRPYHAQPAQSACGSRARFGPRPRPGLVIADPDGDGPITLDGLLAAVPRYVVDDRTALVTRADPGLLQVRAAVPSSSRKARSAVGRCDGSAQEPRRVSPSAHAHKRDAGLVEHAVDVG